KPDPRSWEVGLLVQPLEWAEQVLCVSHVETSSIVPNKEHAASVGMLHSHFNSWLRHFRRKLPGVSDQIVQGHPTEPAVSVSHEFLRDSKLDAALRIFVLQFLEDRVRDTRDIDSLSFQFGSTNARQQQEIINQLAHALRRLAHAA